jgi:hypothetical protein
MFAEQFRWLPVLHVPTQLSEAIENAQAKGPFHVTQFPGSDNNCLFYLIAHISLSRFSPSARPLCFRYYCAA